MEIVEVSTKTSLKFPDFDAAFHDFAIKILSLYKKIPNFHHCLPIPPLIWVKVE